MQKLIREIQGRMKELALQMRLEEAMAQTIEEYSKIAPWQIVVDACVHAVEIHPKETGEAA